MLINQDTQKVLSLAQSIKTLSKNYEILINDIFELIDSSKNYWAGVDAEQFFASVPFEKSDYVTFYNNLNKFAEILTNDANYINQVASNSKFSTGRSY